MATKAPDFEQKDSLIETLIRYSISYLEEFNYELKLAGLRLIDHLTDNISQSQLNANLRSKLLIDTLERYLHDKDSHEFLNRILATMCSCLKAYEAESGSIGQHSFKKHSQILDSMLSNCYMTSDLQVKIIYYGHVGNCMRQMGNFASRHLEKMLTICFECSEHLQIGFDFSTKQALLSKAVDLLQSIIQHLHLRVHAHSKRIINFLIKLIYFATCSTVNANSEPLVKKMVSAIEELFKNARVRELHLEDFRALAHSTNAKSEQNRAFYTSISHIC